MSLNLILDVLQASAETLYMTAVSTLLASLLGLPLGLSLFVFSRIKPHQQFYRITAAAINFVRSIPFIILLVALIPLTRFLIGTSIGINAALVPLTIGAIPFYARLVDNIMQNLPVGLIETGFSMGASTRQMLRYILLPEAFPALIQATTVTAIALVNYTAMAGTIGGGGLGDLAIRYGYQRFNPTIMVITIIILVIIVQFIQMLGDKLAQRYTH